MSTHTHTHTGSECIMKLPREEIENSLDNKLDKSGGTLTGTLYTDNMYPTGDWRKIGEVNNPYGVLYSNAIELLHETPYIDFHYNGITDDYTARIIELDSGTLTVYYTISNVSDERLKNNIENIDNKYMELLDNLEVKSYNFNDSELKDCGLIAQEVLKEEEKLGIDESVLIRGTGETTIDENNGKEITNYYSLNYSNLTALLLKKIQLLEKRIEALEIEQE